MYKHYLGYLHHPADSGAGSGGSTGGDEGDSLSRDLGDLGDDSDDKGGKKDDSGDDSDEGEGDSDSDEDDGDDGEGDDEDAGDEEGGEKGARSARGAGDGEDEEEEEEKPKEIELDATGRPTIKSIKTKYPTLFKDFPELKSAFFLLPKFQEVYADPEAAREAADKALEYDALESSLIGEGNPELLLTTIAKNNPKALKKIAENFGEALRSADGDTYAALSTPIIEELLYHATRHADKIGDKNLRLSCRHLANFVFANGGEIPDISKREKREPHPAEKKLEEERAAHDREKMNAAASEIGQTAAEDLGRLISAKLGQLTKFERRQVIRETRLEIDEKLKRDAGFQRTMRGLWARVRSSGYSDESKERVKQAWLSRARSIAPGIRNRLRQEALSARTPGEGSDSERFEKSERIVGEREKETGEKEKAQKRQFPTKGGKPSGSRRVLDPHKIDWTKTTDLDILNS